MTRKEDKSQKPKIAKNACFSKKFKFDNDANLVLATFMSVQTVDVNKETLKNKIFCIFHDV